VAVRVREAFRTGGLLCVMMPLIAGCGSDAPHFAPTEGTVTQMGKPLAEAKIVLHPLEMQPTGLPLPIAISDEAGHFRVTTLSNNDGALPGKYTVTVELRALRRAGEEMVRDGKLLLPPRYADPATSDFKREIHPGENHWEPIALPR
jgi:hypothetical protein